MPRRFPTLADAAISEARERMAAMAPGDLIEVPVGGGRYTAMRATNSIRYHAVKLWGKGHAQVMHRGLTGFIALARRPSGG